MENNIFHVINRGVEKRKIFLHDKDYLRFSHNIKDFNTIKNVPSYFNRRIHNYGSATSVEEELVDVLCWCLMPNHSHMITINKIDMGTSFFSKKIFGGYTKYFNKENKRSGVLFQGRSKIIPIEKDEHLLHLPFYIHSNPLNLLQPNWKETGIKDIKKALKFLEKYRWSSYLDIIGKENFPDTTNKKLFYEIFDTNEKRYKKDFEDWLSSFNFN
ncbi:MAG: hypothetical protein NUV64_01690 [Parcubacteria group bacterium]|nr:hypothetical protein [Parcubacteria group bacterium]MCR4342753.1 hypothetical protein [Patescibacteria group bacterium]